MSEVDRPLTLKDRLNFPYLLANQILTFQKSLLALEYSEREIRETIEGFIHLIPDDWKDQDFRDDLDNAEITLKTDLRPIVAGNLRMSEEACEKLGIPTVEEKKTFNYFKLFQACMNLLNRRGMLAKINRVEVLEGVDFDEVAKDALLESHVSR